MVPTKPLRPVSLVYCLLGSFLSTLQHLWLILKGASINGRHFCANMNDEGIFSPFLFIPSRKRRLPPGVLATLTPWSLCATLLLTTGGRSRLLARTSRLSPLLFLLWKNGEHHSGPKSILGAW